MKISYCTLLLMLFLAACLPVPTLTPTPTPQDKNDITLDGEYGKLVFADSGTADDWIVIHAEKAEAECVRINGDYIHLIGILVDGCESHGILVDGDHNIVEGSEIKNSVWENGHYPNCKNPGSGWGSGLKAQVGAYDVQFLNNNIHDNCGEGIAITRAIDVLVSGNDAHDNYHQNYYIDNSWNVTFSDNTAECRDYSANGIAVGEEYYSGWGATLDHITIKGNTINGCKRGVVVFESNVGGTFSNSVIDSNRVESGERSMSLLSRNENVTIINNAVFDFNGSWIWIEYPSGVTLEGNHSIE